MVLQFHPPRLRTLTSGTGDFIAEDFSSQPHNTRWLSSAERRLAQVRLAEDTGEADEDTGSNSCVHFSQALYYSRSAPLLHHDRAMKGLRMALKDPKVLIFAVMTCCQLLGTGFTAFFPTYVPRPQLCVCANKANRIAGTLGFSSTVTLLLAAYVSLHRA